MTPQPDSEGIPFDAESVLEILKHAAAHDRTNVEFRKRETPEGEELIALEVTEYVEALEDGVDDTPDELRPSGMEDL